jgi:hypothetical protein
MNVDSILQAFLDHRVEYILIGGMNFLLRHAPVLTFDIDLWIEDTKENRDRCEKALGAIQSEWGVSDADWGPVASKPPGWLSSQMVFCLLSPSGSIDIFRAVKGLKSWSECRRRAYKGKTSAETQYFGLSDKDMLSCQTALEPGEQNIQRIQWLERALKSKEQNHA